MHRAALCLIAAYVGFIAKPASAQWAVIDAAQIAIQENHQIQTMLEWGRQAASFGKQIEGDVRRYNQMVLAYRAISGVRDVGSAVSALGFVGIQNPLPVNPYAMSNLLSGRGGATGMMGSLSGLYTGSLASNRVYETDGTTFYDRQVNEQAGAIAGTQSTLLQLYDSAAQRFALLNQLQARLATETDPAGRETLHTRISIENAYLANTQVQANAITGISASQDRLRRQQREEQTQQSIDEVLADARARGYIQ